MSNSTNAVTNDGMLSRNGVKPTFSDSSKAVRLGQEIRVRASATKMHMYVTRRLNDWHKIFSAWISQLTICNFPSTGQLEKSRVPPWSFRLLKYKAVKCWQTRVMLGSRRRAVVSYDSTSSRSTLTWHDAAYRSHISTSWGVSLSLRKDVNTNSWRGTQSQRRSREVTNRASSSS
jgi:hypothetical protein